MHMKMKKLTALFLVIALLSAMLSGCGADNVGVAETIRGSGSVSEALSSALSTAGTEPRMEADGIHADVDYADMTWYV